MSNIIIKPKEAVADFQEDTAYIIGDRVNYKGNIYELVFHVTKSLVDSSPGGTPWEDYTAPDYDSAATYKKYVWVKYNNILYQLINPSNYPGVQEDPGENTHGSWSSAGASPEAWSNLEFYTLGNNAYAPSIVSYENLFKMTSPIINAELAPENNKYNNWVPYTPPPIPGPVILTNFDVSYISASYSLRLRWDQHNAPQPNIFNIYYSIHNTNDYSLLFFVEYNNVTKIDNNKMEYIYGIYSNLLSYGNTYDLVITEVAPDVNENDVESSYSNSVIVVAPIPPYLSLATYGLNDLVTYNGITYRLNFNVRKSSGVSPDTQQSEWVTYAYPIYNSLTSYKKYAWVSANNNLYKLVNPSIYPGTQQNPVTDNTGSWEQGYPTAWTDQDYYTLGNDEYAPSIVTHSNSSVYIMASINPNPEIPPGNEFYNNWIPKPIAPSGLSVAYEYDNVDDPLKFEWNRPISDPVQFKIYYSLTPNNYTLGLTFQSNAVIKTTTKCSVSSSLSSLNLNRGYVYYFGITAINESGDESEKSNIYEIAIILPLPVIQTGLAITYNSLTNTLQFQWNNRERFPNQVFLFNIYYKSNNTDNYQNGIFYIPSNNVNVNLNNKITYSYLIPNDSTTLIIGNTYDFVITEMVYMSFQNDEERSESDFSNPSVQISLVSSPLPVTPSGLAVTYNSNNNTLELSWADNNTRPPEFYVYYALTGNEMINRLPDSILIENITDFSEDRLHYTYTIPNNIFTNNTYDLTISAYDGGSMAESEKSNIVTITISGQQPSEGPDPPTITAVINQDSSTTLYWIPPSTNGGISLYGYRITYIMGQNTPVVINITTPSITSYKITGLDNDISGNGNIQAIDINGGLSNFDLGEFKLKPKVPFTFTVNITSEQDLKNRLIKLKWITNNNYQYALQYKISGYTKKVFYRISPSEVIHNGTTYTYNFNPNIPIYNKAYNIKIYVCQATFKENGIVYINGPKGPSNLTTCFLPTQVPKNLNLLTSPGNEISILNWNYNAISNINNGEPYFANEPPIFNGGSPILYYTINCTNPSGISDISYNPILDISNNPLFYTVKNLTNETDYTFRIRAVNAVGPSEWSLSKTVTPDNPYELRVTDISFHSMTLRWNYIVSQGYRISIDFSGNLINLSNTSNSYTINNLKEGTLHAISLLPIDYGGTYSMYEKTAPYTPNMSLPPGQSSYNILINGQIVNVIPTTSLASARSGTQILLNDSNYYSASTLVNYVNTDISGQTALLSSSILSVSKGIYNTLITTSETGTQVIYKGLLQILDGTHNLTLVDISFQIIASLSTLKASSNRVGLVAYKNPSASELLNRIVGKFYFKLMDSKNNSFVSSDFNLPFYYTSSNIISTTEKLSVLKFNTSTNSYQFVTNAILQNDVFSFNLSGNSSYIIQQQVPDPPTSVSVTQTVNQIGNYVYVNFTAPTFAGASPITSYVVTYTKTGTTKTISKPTSPILIPSLTITKSYTFTIKAVNSSGSSSASEPVLYTPIGSGTTTSDPYQLRVTDIDFNSMTFRWNYSSPDGYKISIDSSNNLIQLPRNRNSYTINNLQEGTVHFMSLSTSAYNDPFTIYGTTLPYTPNMVLPSRESSYNILINNQIINFIPTTSLELVPNGTQILLKNLKYYSTPTLVNYVNTNIFGSQTVLLSSSIVSASKGIYNTLITTYETGAQVIYKGLLQILNGNDLILKEDSSEIIVAFSNLTVSSNRIGLVTFKNPTASELLNRIVGKFYFKLMDSTNGGSFVSSGFNLPFYYSSKNINSTAEKLSVLKFNTLTNSYEFVTNAILENSLFSFDISGNSTYIIQQQVPDPPTNVSVTQNIIKITNYVYINFIGPTFVGASPITSYVVTYTQNSTTKTITIPIREFKYNIMVPSLIIGTSYTFTVKAVNSFGSSSNSKNVLYIPTGNGTITSNPYQLRVTDIDFHSMIFRWDYPSSDGYRISIDNSSNLINLPNNTNSYTINNLQEGTLHSISLLTSAYTDPFIIYGSTLPYTTNMSLPDGQSSYNILINDQIINFVPTTSLSSAPNGTQILLKDTNYYSTPTLVNYVNTDISGQNALISSSIVSVSKGIFDILLITSETGTQVTQKGVLQILDSIHDVTLTNDLSEIIVGFSNLRAYLNRIGLVTFKNPSANELSNGIVGKFYFKLIDSTGDDSFIYSRFKLPFYYSSSNIKSTTKSLNVLKFNTISNSYQFITNTTVRNNIFSFNLSSNSTYIIQQQVPDPPTDIYVTQTGKDIYINFTAPTFVGGSPITSYVVSYLVNNGVNIIPNTVTGISSAIMIPYLAIGRDYKITITSINSFGSSSNSQPILYKPFRSTITNDPHITTVAVISYLLFNTNGKFLLFNNKNPEYNLYITADCYFLNEQELQSAAFTSKYLTDNAFMRTVNIKFRNKNIIIDMNTLEVTGITNNEIIIQQSISDKLAIGKFYSQSRRNELGLSLRFDGRSRKINLIYKDIIYTIKVAVDLGCADHRNDISIEGPNLESGYGALISPDHIVKISNL